MRAPWKFLTLIVITGLMLSLLAIPAGLGQAMAEGYGQRVGQLRLGDDGVAPRPILPPALPRTGPGLRPNNPVINPLSNTHTAPATSSVSITYDEVISPASVSTRTFAVHARQTGLLTGAYSTTGGTIRLQPPQPFKPGELVQVSATTGTLNLSGQGPLSPTVWQFQVGVSGGYGSFVASDQSFPLSDTLVVVLGDVNEDDHLDAFVANWVGSEGVNEIWLNQGDGTFTKTPQRLGSTQPFRAALGDLDRDGDLDLFAGAANVGAHDEIWLNNGSGVFTRSAQSLTSSSNGGLALGDLDGDGDLDAVIGHLGFDLANQVWFNDGTGVFSDSLQRLGNADTYDIALGDLDGDGDLDAFVANGYFGGDQPNEVWLNDGSGLFTDSGQRLGSRQSTGVELGDLDNDSDLDAFVTHYQGQPNEIWFNDGAGVFSDSGQQLDNEESWDVKLGDLDGDGDLDAFVAEANLFGERVAANRVWLNEGDGIFRGTGQSLGYSASFSLDLGDLDGDGDLDAFVGRADPQVYYTPEGDSNVVWLNKLPHLYLPIIFKSNRGAGPH